MEKALPEASPAILTGARRQSLRRLRTNIPPDDAHCDIRIVLGSGNLDDGRLSVLAKKYQHGCFGIAPIDVINND
ncbi:hypothetical protein FHS26_001604 [Rhizobium pisi]|uniref:Uncharacterized protein n=1 Tax=Rhizobium pisi TaxID=574561 RepID=A0A3R9BSH1_9HYPH|nr:hypothetical protein [Rhizobium pisi]MBB3133891.1 hypothetical protein [Rhizobium pisi]RSB81869.1 hypothetical protein EFD55_07975 [Rhizobium pisi]TCA42192.1 hypothetical protein E0J16_33665 [Rhizobium pisi]